MSSISQFLPEPKHQTSSTTRQANAASSEAEAAPVTTELVTTGIPALGQRKGWVPKTQADFGDGGAYPEIHVLQYPHGMGRKRGKKGNALVKQVDGMGNVSHDAIARYGRRENETVQSTFSELVPLRQRTGFDDAEAAIPARPSDAEVHEAAERTKRALEKIVGGRISAAAAARGVKGTTKEPTYVRYTPNQQAPGFNSGAAQRIVRITDMPVDPMEPPKIRNQKAARRAAEPPAPVMHSPPRKLTADEQREWVIPPCVSNWKNIHGFTVSLDKRLAADGRGIEDLQVSDNFASLSDALAEAEAQARREIAERANIQQTIARREKDAKEERLRLLAQRAREERAVRGDAYQPGTPEAESPAAGSSKAGSPPPQSPKPQARRDAKRKTAGDFFSSSPERPAQSGAQAASDDETEAAARERDQLRREHRKQLERSMRLGGSQQQQQRRAEARDISEKIALGIAKPTAARETMFDSRLFDRASAANTSMADDTYNLYDKPLFSTAGRSATYRPRALDDDGEEAAGRVASMLATDRFGAESSLHGLDADAAKGQPPSKRQRSGPVEFEKGDVFGIDAFVGSTRGSNSKK
ncbi:mRNA splicing protein [Coemansia sp. RSA 2703]|nr:mRNA splicing protein [Coemansia sp. RSA 2703]KAJ2379562.1 mRNA splicing protein [Coemansia sp. RSA 2607]KAJ2398406.1 mRNA splicing protein [Coemansia sp. RSA 2603]